MLSLVVIHILRGLHSFCLVVLSLSLSLSLSLALSVSSHYIRSNSFLKSIIVIPCDAGRPFLLSNTHRPVSILLCSPNLQNEVHSCNRLTLPINCRCRSSQPRMYVSFFHPFP